jgi:uncharacterized membrane protein
MAALQVLVGISYPVLVYLALTSMEPRQVGLVVLGLLALRLAFAARMKLASYTRTFWLPVAVVAGIALVTARFNDPLGLLLAPTLVNLGLLAVFGLSLWREPPMVERFARLQVDHLSPDEIAYCRTVTGVWCAFFLANGGIALLLALGGNLTLWTLYTGLVSYVLIGVLFALEITYRQWRFRRYEGGVTDPLFRRLFPPPAPGLRPQVLAERRFEDRRELDLRVPADLACWPGHFPDVAIVPGVLQLEWVMQEIAAWTGRPADVACIENLKFKRPILPGQELTLVLRSDSEPERFRFELEDDSGAFSLGRIVLAADGEAQ